MSTFSTETLDSTERLAVYITRGQYVGGAIDHDQFEARIASIIGLNGARERARVLETTEVVDVTTFGSRVTSVLPTAWSWPDGEVA